MRWVCLLLVFAVPALSQWWLERPDYDAARRCAHLQVDHWPAPDDQNASHTLYTVSNKPATVERTLLIVCGIHGRELITRRLCMQWLRTMIQQPSKSTLRIVLLLELNPHGLAIAEQRSPCWRGNERGVDLNRNWPLLPWYREDSSEDQSPEVYGGTHPLSEWESQALHFATDYFKPELLIAVHSGAEALLVPYDASDAVRAPNYRDLVKFARWLRADSCPQCLVARSAQLMYAAVGTLTDYHYWHRHADLVVTLEVYGDPEAAAQLRLDNPNLQWLVESATCRALFNPVECSEVLERWQPLFNRLLHVSDENMRHLLAMSGAARRNKTSQL